MTYGGRIDDDHDYSLRQKNDQLAAAEDVVTKLALENTRLHTALSAVVTDLLSLCDGSNWPESAQTGPAYWAYTELTEQIHDIASNLQDFLKPLANQQLACPACKADDERHQQSKESA